MESYLIKLFMMQVAMPMMPILTMIPQALVPAMSTEQQKSSSAHPISKLGGSSVSGSELISLNASCWK